MRRGKAQGGFFYSNAVCRSDLPSGARHLGMLLAFLARNQTGWTKVSVPTMAQLTGMGETTVRRHLRTLETAGYVLTVPAEPWQQREGHPNTYYTLIPPGYPTKTFQPPPAKTEGGQGGAPPPNRAKPPAKSAAGTTSTKAAPGTRSGSASAVPAAPPDPLVRDPQGATLTCTDCWSPIHESQRDGETFWCYVCSADPATTTYTTIDPDPRKHPWERRRLDDLFGGPSDVDPHCAICGKEEDDHDPDLG